MKKFITTEYNEAEIQELIQASIRKVIQEEFTKLIPHFNNSPPANKERLLSRKEVKEILGISYPTISKLTRAGRLKAIVLGGSYRYREQDILALHTSKK